MKTRKEGAINAYRNNPVAVTRGNARPGFSKDETSCWFDYRGYCAGVWSKGSLQRVSDPFWFQGLGCALGFDWHSSGLTTTTCAALKEGLKCREKELGFFIAGGKGKTSLRTPQEIEAAGSKFALGRHIEALQDTSRLVAKVDNTALQDGYNLYHHCIFFTDKGDWSVVQQGMNENTRWKQRYHWLGEGLKSFVSEPHKAICCDYRQQNILNLIAAEVKKTGRTALF